MADSPRPTPGAASTSSQWVDATREPQTAERVAASSFDRDLPGQFVLSRSSEWAPAGWTVRQLHGWTLASHPGLRVVALRALDGPDVGWLLGDPINEYAAFLPDVVALPFDHGAPASHMEAWLSRLCGRFLAIWLTPIYERVYPDAGALLASVFAPEPGLLASTTSLIPYGRGCDDDPELTLPADRSNGRAVMAFGLTPRRGVERLQPNHHLDLNSWTTQRHWPTAPLDATCDPIDAIQTVARMVRRHLAAGLRRGDVRLALTAGLDSRALLACSREYVDRIEVMTLAIPDATGRIDVEVAARIAARHGLRHRVLENSAPTREELDGWLWRTGGTMSEPRGWRASRPSGPVSEVTGAGGEAARVAYWRDAGEGKRDVTAEVLVECARMAPTPRILERAHRWMSNYPATTPVQLLDGFFIEQSLGVTAGANMYGDAGFVSCRLHPYVNREVLDALSRMPENYKLSRQFPLDLIRCYWPALLRTPINRREGMRHVVDRARRRAWLTRRAIANTLHSR